MSRRVVAAVLGNAARAARSNASSPTSSTIKSTRQKLAATVDPRLAALGPMQSRRPIFTVVDPTKMNAKGQITDPGHIQFQTTEQEQEATPGLPKALGHSRRTDLPVTKRTRVSGQFPNGQSFDVRALTGPAINYGDDKPISLDKKGVTVINHGPLSRKTADELREAGKEPLKLTYETSGQDGTNCVSVHYYVANNLLGMKLGELHKHATPQDLGEQLVGRTLGDSKGDENK